MIKERTTTAARGAADTPHDGYHFETFGEALEHRARTQPLAIGYTFLTDGESREASLTYGALRDRAGAIAGRLRELGGVGGPVLLMFPPGLEFVSALFGCLLAPAIAVPAYPPLNTKHLPRLEAIVRDAGAQFALTTTAALARIRRYLDGNSALDRMTWIVTDDLSAAEQSWMMPSATRETVALLQYTSGSTGDPKGVMLTHRHLLVNARAISGWLRRSDSSPGVSWLPPYHDLGLMGSVLHPIYDGFRAIMMSPVAFLQRPGRWLKAISTYRATVGGGPNFAFDLLARTVTDEELCDLDLSCWSVAYCGAEPVRAETIARFVARFEGCGFRGEAFYPGYGLAEATLMVAARQKGTPLRIRRYRRDDLERDVAVVAASDDVATCALVSCGAPPPEQDVRIVDPLTLRPCPPQRLGEIWVRGSNVALGYWRRGAETEATFQARIAGTDEGPFLRTGDLGVFEDGELIVAGRLKDLIIIDGRNHYPQDIERTVEASHVALRSGACAAFTVEVDGRESLVVVVERWRNVPIDTHTAAGVVRSAVASTHGLHVQDLRFVPQGTLHMTSSGKVQRRACKGAYLANEWPT